MIEAILHPVKAVLGEVVPCPIDEAQTFGLYMRSSNNHENEIHIKDFPSIGEGNAMVKSINKAIRLVADEVH